MNEHADTIEDWIRQFFSYLVEEAKALGLEGYGHPEKVSDWTPYLSAQHSASAVGMLIASAMNQEREKVNSSWRKR